MAPVCTGAGTGVRRYVLGPDPDERWAFLDMNGTIDSPHTDREGTLIAVSNDAQAVAQYAYDAYGQNANTASDVGPGARSYLYRYTGQRLDPNTGLYDYKARDYSPMLGRFQQPDPAGVDQGPNLYEYVGDDPVDRADPSGESDINLFPEFGAAGASYDLWNNAKNFNPPGFTTIAGHGNVGFIRDSRTAEIPDFGPYGRNYPLSKLYKEEKITALKTLIFLSCNAGSLGLHGSSALAQSAANSSGRFAFGSTGEINSHTSGLFGENVTFSQDNQKSPGASFVLYSPNGKLVSGIGVKSITFNTITRSISYDGQSIVSGSVTQTGSRIPIKITCDQSGCH